MNTSYRINLMFTWVYQTIYESTTFLWSDAAASVSVATIRGWCLFRWGAGG